MSLFKRSPRRSIATVAAVGALAAAAIVAPSLAAPALASDTSTAKSLFADLNAWRTSGSVGANALLPNGFANTAAAGLAKLYAGSGHPCTTNPSYPAPSTPDAAQFNVPVCETLTAGSSEATKLLAKFDTSTTNKPVIESNIYDVAGVGVYTKSGKVYAVIDMLAYGSGNEPAEQLTIGKPTISGTAQIGKTLTATYPAAITDNGSTTGITYTVEWLTGGSLVHTGSTYSPQASYVGDKFDVKVTSSKSGFVDAFNVSSNTKAVVKGVFKTTGGSSKFGQLGAVITPTIPSTVTPSVDPTYQWYVGSTPEDGVSGLPAFFSPTVADLGKNITVKVTWFETGYTTLTKTYAIKPFKGLSYQYSGGVLPGAGISGYTTNPHVGNTLTATAPDWLGTVTTQKFTWEVNGVVKGTGSTIVVKSSWVGKTITVTYTASGGTYKKTSVKSAKTPKVKS